jgi:D-psicose/D-tagatose/L-ribulose 3-epimerase
MKFGVNLYLWADEMHDGLMSVLERLKQIGFDGVEVPIFDLDQAKWAVWGQRLDYLGPQRTAINVIAAEHNPLSDDPAVREAAYRHLKEVIGCCAAVGSGLLCGPHQVALGVFTGKGATDEEWKRSVDHLRRAVHAHVEEKDPACAIRRAGARIAHVHISENDRGVPGTGSVQREASFAALRDVGYDGWLNVEAFGNFLPNLAAATRIWGKLFDSEEELAADAYTFLASHWDRGAHAA